MVRPNHDIPHKLLGSVRDYAEKHDIEAEEAHKRLLRMSLVAVGELPAAVLTETDSQETPDWLPDTLAEDVHDDT